MARVLAAMAWSGGQIQENEKRFLLRLLEDLGLSPQERAQVTPILETPVTIEQFAALAGEFRAAGRSEAERRGWFAQMRDRITAYPDCPPQEKRYLDLLRSWIDEEEIAAPSGPAEASRRLAPSVRGFLGDLRRRAGEVGQGWRNSPVAAALGEALSLRVGHRAAGEFLSPARRHFVTLYGALLYRVIRADNVVRPEEIDRLRVLLSEGFGFAGGEIEPVVSMIESEVAAGADRQHLCAEFNRITEMEDRLALVEALFAVALADGEMSPEEENEIRLISNFLWVETQEYVRLRRQALGGAESAGGRP